MNLSERPASTPVCFRIQNRFVYNLSRVRVLSKCEAKMNCENCGTATKNPKFCSSSCAATTNNRIYQKRPKKVYKCKKCDKFLQAGWTSKMKRVCTDCNSNIRDWSKTTFSNLRNVLGTYQAHARIRAHARDEYRRAKKPRQCLICAYNKHFEVCHIKPIQSFNEDTPVTIVNCPDNLAGLCPNCHWEFDHKLISIG